jgi:hypothetical protein
MSKILDAAFLEKLQLEEKKQQYHQNLWQKISFWQRPQGVTIVAFVLLVFAIILASQTLLPTIVGFPTLLGNVTEKQKVVMDMGQKIEEQNNYLAQLHTETKIMRDRQSPVAVRSIVEINTAAIFFGAAVSNLHRVVMEVVPDNPIAKKIIFKTIRFEPKSAVLIAQGVAQLSAGQYAVTGQDSQTLLEYIALNANRSPYFHDSNWTLLPSENPSGTAVSFQISLPLQMDNETDTKDRAGNFVEYIQQYLQNNKIKR